MLDIFVARYDADGNFNWARQIGGPDTSVEKIVGLAVDKEGGVIAFGSMEGDTVFDMNNPEAFVINAPVRAFVCRFQKDGSLDFAVPVTTGGFFDGKPLALTLFGEIVVSGDFIETTHFGQGEYAQTLTSPDLDSSDFYLAKLDERGNLMWVTYATGAGRQAATALEALPDGTLLVAGLFNEEIILGPDEPNETRFTATPCDSADYCRDIFLARYESDGTLREAVSMGGADMPQNEFASDLAYLDDGNAVLVGTFGGAAAEFPIQSAEPLTLSAAGNADAFIFEFSLD